jgi:hypothetical protein
MNECFKRGQLIMNEFNKIKYNNNYNKENYINIQFKIRKDEKPVLLELAKRNGYNTLSSYAKFLLETASDIDSNNKLQN